MSTTTLGLPLTSLTIARGIAISFGCLSTFMGARAITDPSGYARTFGIPASSLITRDASTNPFIAVAGGSRLAGGLALLTCLYFRQDRAAAINFITASFVGVVDAFSLRAEVNRVAAAATGKNDDDPKVKQQVEEAMGQVYGHMIFGPISLALGVWLWRLSE